MTDKPMTPDAALAAARDAAALGNIQFMDGPKVWRYPDLLKRFMKIATGGDGGFFVSDGSHLSDFGFDAAMLEEVRAEFGIPLPGTDLYLWEALMLLHGPDGAQGIVSRDDEPERPAGGD